MARRLSAYLLSKWHFTRTDENDPIPLSSGSDTIVSFGTGYLPGQMKLGRPSLLPHGDRMCEKNRIFYLTRSKRRRLLRMHKIGYPHPNETAAPRLIGPPVFSERYGTGPSELNRRVAILNSPRGSVTNAGDSPAPLGGICLVYLILGSAYP